jgi:hypothetical protein
MIIAAVLGAAVVFGGLALVMRPSSKGSPVAEPVAAKPAAPAAAVAPAVPPPAEAAKPVEAAKSVEAGKPADTAKTGEATATPAGDKSESRSRRKRHSDQPNEAKVDPLHRQIAVPAETTPTPAEIKPFPTN